MVYNSIATDEMNMLLDNSVRYLLNKFKSEQAAEHLLSGAAEIYDQLESNPNIYRISRDPFMKALEYHEAKVNGMDYMIIYKIEEQNVYILGIFHTLENYAEHTKIIWNSFNP